MCTENLNSADLDLDFRFYYYEVKYTESTCDLKVDDDRVMFSQTCYFEIFSSASV